MWAAEPPPAPPPAVVSIPAGTTPPILTLSGEHYVATVPLVWPTVANAANVTLTPLSLTKDHVELAMTADQVQGDFLASGNERPALVQISLNSAVFPDAARAGIYRIVFRLDRTQEGDTKAIGDLVVAVSMPKSVLNTVPALKVRETIGAIVGDGRQDGHQFWLRLSSGHPFTPKFSPMTAVPGGSVSAALVDPNAVVSPSTSIPAHIQPGDDLELGTTEATILMTGPAMDAVTLSVSVDRRLSTQWIPLIAAIGILLGLAVRVGLARFQDRQQLDVRLKIAEAELTDIEARYPNDAVLTHARKLRELILLWETELSGSGLETTLKTMDKTFTESKQALEAAMKTYDVLVKTELEKLNALGAVFVKKRTLTDAWQTRAASVAQAIAQIGHQLDNQRDIDTAKTQKKATLETFFGEIRHWAERWQQSLPGVQRTLEQLDPPLPLGVMASMTPQITKAGALTPLPANDSVSVENLATHLDALHKRAVETRAISYGFVSLCCTDARTVLSLLTKAAQPTQTLNSAIETLNRRLEQDLLSEPAEQPLPLAQALLTLNQALTNTIEAVAGASVPQNVTRLLQMGAYELAAKLAIDPKDAAALGEASGLLAQPPTGMRAMMATNTTTGTPPAAAPAAPPPAQTAATSWIELLLSAPPALRSYILRKRRSIVLAQSIATVFSFVALTIVAWVVFHSTFVGTPTHVLAILGWSFTLDVGLGSLVTQLQSTRFVGKLP